MSVSQSSVSSTPEQSEDFQESSEETSQDSEEVPMETPAQEPADGGRKKRTTLTHEIVTRFLEEFNKPDRSTIKNTAEKVGISFTTAKKLLRDIRCGNYDCGDMIVYHAMPKGRKPVRNEKNETRVKEVLTQSTTVTLEKAKEILAAENINMSRATICRIAKDQDLSYQKTTSRAGVVFTRDSIEKRHDYAVQVDGIPNHLVWFLDETEFTLHIAPLRAWSKRGKTPVQPVPANRQTNLSLLMCIGHDGVKYTAHRDGAFTAKAFLESIRALSRQFPEVRHGEVTLVMDNAPIHRARCVVDYLNRKGINYLYLPPYSPDLNPIENVFGVLKAKYRSMGIPTTRDEMTQQVASAIDELRLDMLPFYARMRSFVRKGLNRESFE